MTAFASLDRQNVPAHRLTTAVLIYEGGGSGETKSAVATVHRVQTVGDRPVISAGAEVTDSFLKRLHFALAPRAARAAGTLHFLAPEILGFNSDCLLWYSPSVRRPMYFAAGDELGRLSGSEFLHPGLLFFARRNRFQVFALADPRRRPDPSTPLYFAPYYNVNSSGQVCWGSVPLPKALSPDHAPVWESLFFTSRFTHSNYGNVPPTRHAQGLKGLWRTMGEATLHRFPARYLKRTGFSIRDLCAGSVTHL